MQSLVPSGPPSTGNYNPASGIKLEAIAEVPAWTDLVLAQFFRDMRKAAGGTRGHVAARLGTTADVILALESGHLRALPSWPVTQRIVRAYGRLVDLDMGPVLVRLRQQTAAADPRLPDDAIDGVFSLPSIVQSHRRTTAAPQMEPSEQERSLWWRRPVTALPVLLLASLVFVPRVPSTLVEAGISALPATVADVMRSALQGQADKSAERLVWIEVSDPRTRKSDKLRPDPR